MEVPIDRTLDRFQRSLRIEIAEVVVGKEFRWSVGTPATAASAVPCATSPKTLFAPSRTAYKTLFGFIIDASDERGRQVNAKRPSSGEIDRQTEQVRLIDLNIARLCTFEDLVDKAGKAPC